MIIRNLPGIVKFYAALSELNAFKKNIEKAKAEGNKEVERENILKATSAWGNRLLKYFKLTVDFAGEENIPQGGPVVYVCNHQGYMDVPVLCAVLEKLQFGFISKNELSKVPLYGPWIKRIRSIMIQRDDARASLEAISQGVKNINDGFSMLIFPEGTRSKGESMGEFKKGALKLATKPKVPIVPISLNGTFKAYEETGLLRPAFIKVLVHPPIDTATLSRDDEKHLSDKVFQIIAQGLETLKD